MENIELTQVEKEAPLTIRIWDNTGRAKNLLIVFYIITATLPISIISSYLEIELLKDIQIGLPVSDEAIMSNDLRQGILGIFQLVLFIVTAIFFIQWFRRAYGNLHRVGLTYLRHGESWALWSWFIPILSLINPPQIMSEIWKETQYVIQKTDRSYQVKEGGLYIGIWWTLFVIGNFIGQFIFRSVLNDEDISSMIYTNQAYIISDMLQIIEGLMVIALVTSIKKMEGKLADVVVKNGGAVISV